jgi:predicted transposase/invertase (TIGR01784 family)
VLSELDDEELMASGNPIDIVLYAAKYAAKTKAELQRYNYLRTATRLLADMGWDMDEKYAFLLFAQRVINLKDEKLKAEYIEYLEQLDREGKIVYVTMAEEYYTKKGIEQGIEKGKLEVARKLAARGISPDIITESTGLPVDQIQELTN